MMRGKETVVLGDSHIADMWDAVHHLKIAGYIFDIRMISVVFVNAALCFHLVLISSPVRLRPACSDIPLTALFMP